MARDSGKSSLRRRARDALWMGRAMPLTRAVAGLAAAALLGSMALAAAWIWAAATGGIEHRVISYSPRLVSWGTTIPSATTAPTLLLHLSRVDPRPEALMLPLAMAGVVWLALLWRIWGPPRGAAFPAPTRQPGRRGVLMPAVVSVAVLLAVVVGIILIGISDFVPGDQRYMITAVFMGGGGLLLGSWLGVIEQMQVRFKPVLDAEGQVDVKCPGCGYLLVGLRDLRCPECGMQFTIDELIRAQGYDRPQGDR